MKYICDLHVCHMYVNYMCVEICAKYVHSAYVLITCVMHAFILHVCTWLLLNSYAKCACSSGVLCIHINQKAAVFFMYMKSENSKYPAA